MHPWLLGWADRVSGKLRTFKDVGLRRLVKVGACPASALRAHYIDSVLCEHAL